MPPGIHRLVVREVRVDEILIAEGRREVDQEAVERLKASIPRIGLKTPITIRNVETPNADDGQLENGWWLVVGRHRLEAHRQLGLEYIDAVFMDSDEIDAELWEIDENLCRAELSPADRALYMARRKAVYLEKHPETARGVAGAEGKHRATEKFSASFAADTAAKTGQTERIVRLHAERGEKVAPGVLSLVRGTHLDNGVYLDSLKKLPHDQQCAKVEHDLAAGKKRIEGARLHKTKAAGALLSDASRMTILDKTAAEPVAAEAMGRDGEVASKSLELLDTAYAAGYAEAVQAALGRCDDRGDAEVQAEWGSWVSAFEGLPREKPHSAEWWIEHARETGAKLGTHLMMRARFECLSSVKAERQAIREAENESQRQLKRRRVT